MSTNTESLNDPHDNEPKGAQPAVQTQGATTNGDAAPDLPGWTPPNPDPGPDR